MAIARGNARRRAHRRQNESATRHGAAKTTRNGASGAAMLDDVDELHTIDGLSDRRATQYLVSGGGSADGKVALWRCAV